MHVWHFPFYCTKQNHFFSVEQLFLPGGWNATCYCDVVWAKRVIEILAPSSSVYDNKKNTPDAVANLSFVYISPLYKCFKQPSVHLLLWLISDIFHVNFYGWRSFFRVCKNTFSCFAWRKQYSLKERYFHHFIITWWQCVYMQFDVGLFTLDSRAEKKIGINKMAGIIAKFEKYCNILNFLGRWRWNWNC